MAFEYQSLASIGAVESLPQRGSVSASLDSLTTPELAALRLSAQVMAHRADLAGAQAARIFFESLEAAVMAEEAGRGQTRPRAASSAHGSGVAGLLSLPASRSDRALITDSLAQLASNDRLPPAIRQLCRRLEIGVRTPFEAQA